MNYVDMFILVLLIYAVFKGFTRGFIMQLTLLVALALGIFAAVKLSDFTAVFLDDKLHVNRESLHLIALGLTFVLVFVGVNLAGSLVEKMAGSAELSLVNRLAGVFFSVAKTVLLIGILLAYVDRIDYKMKIMPKYTREHSLFYKPFANIARAVFPSLHMQETEMEPRQQV